MFDRMTLRKKLTLGFGLILVLLVAIGGVGFQALLVTADGFTSYRGMARDTNLAGRVQANMLMLRVNVKDFLITGSEEDKQQFNKYLQEVQDFMQEAQDEIKEPQRAALIDQIDSELINYEKGFQEVVALSSKRNQLVSQVIYKVGPQMEKVLTQLLLSAKQNGNMTAALEASMATRSLMLARLYVVKFLETNEQAAVEKAAKEFQDMELNLQVLEGQLRADNLSQLKQVRELKTAYQQFFAEITNLIFTRNDIVKTRLDKIGLNVAKLIEDVKLSIKSEQDALGPKMQAETNRAKRLIAIIGLVATLIGIGIAMVIIRGILAQMGGDPAYVIDVATQVAAGDLDMDLPNHGEKAESLYAAIRHMVAKLQEKAQLAEKIASGDLTTEVSLASEKDALGKSLRNMVANLNEILGQIQVAGEQIATGSSQISDGAQSLSQGATESAASVEEITAP